MSVAAAAAILLRGLQAQIGARVRGLGNRLFPGRVRPLDEPGIRSPARWIG